MTDDYAVYGPLAALIGNWSGNRGVDLAPEPDGEEREPYYETILYEAIGDLKNAEEERIWALRYHQVVYRQRNGEMFHNETGYWMWSASNKTVMHSLTIPRGVCVLAGGIFDGDCESGKPITISVAAKLGDPDWGIIQSPFMSKKASTLAFSQTVTVDGDRMEYQESTLLDIYGRKFDHTDGNILTRA
jgi:methylamine---glutamate N-methyltransferase subunit C